MSALDPRARANPRATAHKHVRTDVRSDERTDRAPDLRGEVRADGRSIERPGARNHWPSLAHGPALLLQRKCACGGSAGMAGECEDCQKQKLLGLQTKREPAPASRLVIGEANDRYEQEADRVADDVVADDRGHPRERAPMRLQRVASNGAGFDAAPQAVRSALSAPSRNLDPQTRAYFEPRFGHDFAHVRVHDDAAADASARAVGARAYTVGAHVVFAKGQYAPHGAEGRRLLAHELAHTIQQTSTSAGLRLQRQTVKEEPAAGCGICYGWAMLAGSQAHKEIQREWVLPYLLKGLGAARLAEVPVTCKGKRRRPDIVLQPANHKWLIGSIKPARAKYYREGEKVFQSYRACIKASDPTASVLPLRVPISGDVTVLPFPNPQAQGCGTQKFNVNEPDEFGVYGYYCDPGRRALRRNPSCKCKPRKKEDKKKDDKKKQQAKQQKAKQDKAKQDKAKKQASKKAAPKQGKQAKGGKASALKKLHGLFGNIGFGIGFGSAGSGSANASFGVSIASNGVSYGTVSAGVVYNSDGIAIGTVSAGAQANSTSAAAGTATAGAQESGNTRAAGTSTAGTGSDASGTQVAAVGKASGGTDTGVQAGKTGGAPTEEEVSEGGTEAAEAPESGEAAGGGQVSARTGPQGVAQGGERDDVQGDEPGAGSSPVAPGLAGGGGKPGAEPVEPLLGIPGATTEQVKAAINEAAAIEAKLRAVSAQRRAFLDWLASNSEDSNFMIPEADWVARALEFSEGLSDAQLARLQEEEWLPGDVPPDQVKKNIEQVLAAPPADKTAPKGDPVPVQKPGGKALKVQKPKGKKPPVQKPKGKQGEVQKPKGKAGPQGEPEPERDDEPKESQDERIARLAKRAREFARWNEVAATPSKMSVVHERTPGKRSSAELYGIGTDADGKEVRVTADITITFVPGTAGGNDKVIIHSNSELVSADGTYVMASLSDEVELQSTGK